MSYGDAHDHQNKLYTVDCQFDCILYMSVHTLLLTVAVNSTRSHEYESTSYLKYKQEIRNCLCSRFVLLLFCLLFIVGVFVLLSFVRLFNA